MKESNSRGKTPADAIAEQPIVTTRTLRNRITDRIELNDTVTRQTVIADVARDLNMTESRVEREFDKLHKNGFVYIVNDDPAEVRTP